MLCFRTHISAMAFLRLISDDFWRSSVFLKANNRFHACGEKCLKQGVSNSISVMVIRCVRTYNNIRHVLLNSQRELEDTCLIIVVVARKAGNDHDMNKSFTSPCKFFSEHAERKAIWPLEKQEGLTNLR